ncbi:MAG: response regulator transcription factor [Eubacteriales bacterium]|jgi:DNA-binding NarL/FixJ family response regulator
MTEREQIAQIEYVAKFGKLSKRENQVTKLLFEGKTGKMIAAELHISENTVKYYIKNIYYKFNVQSRTELICSILKGKNEFLSK